MIGNDPIENRYARDGSTDFSEGLDPRELASSCKIEDYVASKNGSQKIYIESSSQGSMSMEVRNARRKNR